MFLVSPDNWPRVTLSSASIAVPTAHVWDTRQQQPEPAPAWAPRPPARQGQDPVHPWPRHEAARHAYQALSLCSANALSKVFLGLW